MDWSTLFMVLGLVAACWAVVANDSLQTLGTFIASNKNIKWYWLFLASAVVLVATLLYSWHVGAGDISWGRLERIPLPETFTIWHVIAPLTLLVLTARGIPVSTTFLVLSVFATNVVMLRMVTQSVLGYAIAFVVAYVLWKLLSRVFNEREPIKDEVKKKWWRVAQWLATMFLWSQWLSHDVANMAVYLNRAVEINVLFIFMAILVFFLGVVFYFRGGSIQKIIIDKTSTRYVRSATIIDIVFALILFVFKELSNIPMSTTWVFVGLLAGREFALNSIQKSFPIVKKDLLKVLFGLAISVVIALSASYFLTGG
jgi:hypothetical protein